MTGQDLTEDTMANYITMQTKGILHVTTGTYDYQCRLDKRHLYYPIYKLRYYYYETIKIYTTYGFRTIVRNPSSPLAAMITTLPLFRRKQKQFTICPALFGEQTSVGSQRWKVPAINSTMLKVKNKNVCHCYVT